MSVLGISLEQHFRSREPASYHLNVSTDAEAIKYYICTASVNRFDDPDEEAMVRTQELLDNGSYAAILREWFPHRLDLMSKPKSSLLAIFDCWVLCLTRP